jgi:MscS family membrane protein
LLSLLNRLLGALIGWAIRKIWKRTDTANPTIIPHPVRLLLLGIAIRWSLSKVSLPLLSRQFWASMSIIIAITALVWLFINVSAQCEIPVKKRLARKSATAAASLVRPARRVIDLIAVFVGLLVALYAFGVNPTAALAGLGVGGIAVALAAQKTLENVIGGASIIMDGAIRAGDYLKVGGIEGTVEAIGLRSTRVRTLDRTVVTVPNGQMASVTLENFTFRDWFWFHHLIGLRYETTLSELSSILEGTRDLLSHDLRVVGRDWLRVRLLGFKQSGFEIEVFAYLSARDWPHFLEVQEDLLLQIMELVQAKGARIAPSQTLYLAHTAEPGSTQMETEPFRRAAPTGQ